MAELRIAFEQLADGTIRIELQINDERIGIITVDADGTISVFFIFREAIRNALRNPNYPRDEPVIEDIQNGSLIVKLRFLTPRSFLRFYDDYKSGKLRDSLAKEIAKLTTKPTTEMATTMTVFDESLPVKFKQSLEEKFENFHFDDKLTVKIRDEEKVKNHAEKLRRENTVEPPEKGKMAALKTSFEVLPDRSMRVELEIIGEQLAKIAVFYIFREPIRNAVRAPNSPLDEPVIEDIGNGSLIVKLRFLTPRSFLRFYDDYKLGKLKDSLAEEIAKLTTKPTTETATTMTVFQESLPVKFKESLEEIFKKLTIKIRDEEKVKNHAEKLREHPLESPERVPCIIVCGGAHARLIDGDDQEYGAEVKKGIIQAAEEGYEILKQGDSAVDAVEKAVCVMEDNPSLNAGHGASPTREGGVELDAMIMDGSSLKTGAVMSVSCFSNPVSLAKCVMEKTNHCALNNEGAMEFAKNINFPTTDSRKLVTKTFSTEVGEHDEGHDSVGAVAMDKNGNLACATSTGGIARRIKGRISDAPMVGCGGYANEYGASSVAGLGEALIKMTLAREVIYNLERGFSAQESAEKAIDKLENRIPLAAGAVIVIDQKGNFGKACSTKTMAWATKKGDELRYGFRIPK